MLSLEKQLLFLLSSAASIDVRQLVEIYEKRGIDHQVIRNALARLKKDGYVLSPERSSYSITQPGLDFMNTINRKPLLLDKRWDGQWLSVLFEVPESERKKRDSFRNDLLQLGFGAMYKSVYVSPWDYAGEILRVAENYGLQGRVTLARGVFVHGAPASRQARQIWRLDELNEVYRVKIDWLRTEFRPAIAPLFDEPDDGLNLFVRFLELGELVADLSLSDPMLPEELLEEDWLGRACLREMQEILVRLANAIPVRSSYRAFVARFLHE
ncbi:PaaX family transcriptional regulator C-terminal domain-containing protein [Cohnella zeiphila]|uniref:PaaX family transcriptional regulator n=1 Tax=Cohnella zeiphila TaxID=2761120 RepID=A0A7X0VX38_9BACL|nr:PaaX family transcriptional regulator C-terminal domain-containing protein [Cohnella zeiphila]MBB6733869.1 PaaX family transcriptional regulator [Cohnella zeiphila]